MWAEPMKVTKLRETDAGWEEKVKGWISVKIEIGGLVESA